MAKSFILSDESINSYGFRVLTDGISLKQFKKNPVMLFNHRSWGEGYTGPIGKWENIRVEDGKLMADPVFDDKDEFALKIKSKVEQGFIKGASMGFNVVETSTEDMLAGQTRSTVSKSIIYEASIVDLPGNANALALYDGSGNRIEMDAEKGIELSLNKIFQTPQKIEMVKLKAATLVKLQLNENSTTEQLEAAVEATLTRAETAERELNTFKDKAKADHNLRCENLVNQAVVAKKITDAEKGQYLELAQVNFDLCEKTISKLPGVKNINEQLKKDNPDAAATGRSEWTLAMWTEKDPQGLMKLAQEKPEVYKSLFK
jgi:hypothetical protein